MGATDASLAEAASAGSREAFDVLYRRHRGWVAAYLRGFVRSAEDAEDLVQGVFEKLFAARGRYAPQASFCAWVRAVARNCAIDYLRKQKGLAQAAKRVEMAAGGEGEWVDPAGMLEARELCDELREALRALSPVHRRTVFLRYFGAMSLEEVAEAMGCPVGTVKSRINAALRQMGERLGMKTGGD